MRPSIALAQHRDAARALIARYPVSNPRVFGSVAQGADTEGSDLDLLVDKTEHTTLFDLGGLQMDLQRLLGVPVDVRLSTELHRYFRDNVVRSAKPL